MPIKNLVIKPASANTAVAVKKSQFYRGYSTVYNSKNPKVYDTEIVKQDLLNYLNTRKGERVMNPSFGTIIWDVIFDPLTDVIKEEIRNDLGKILNSDPRFIPLNVNFYEREHGLIIEITVEYSNTDQTETLIINFDKDKGLAA